jgi:hypothetical protein
MAGALGITLLALAATCGAVPVVPLHGRFSDMGQYYTYVTVGSGRGARTFSVSGEGGRALLRSACQPARSGQLTRAPRTCWCRLSTVRRWVSPPSCALCCRARSAAQCVTPANRSYDPSQSASAKPVAWYARAATRGRGNMRGFAQLHRVQQGLFHWPSVCRRGGLWRAGSRTKATRAPLFGHGR